MNNFGIAIHGGAGTLLPHLLTPKKELMYRDALNAALKIAQSILQQNGSSLDAVEAAVKVLEDSPLFNAGRGSVFNSAGKHEMDAAIMNGMDKSCGAIAGVSGVKNPISLARAVMEKTEHVLLAGKGAEDFAKAQNFDFETDAYFFDELRFDQWQKAKEEGKIKMDHTEDGDKKFGTVGAVALDKHGNIAAATSTGGMTNKKFGRVGDTPIIGAGTYANNKTCAVSCTGHGEFFMRQLVAHDISCLIEYKGYTLSQACDVVVNQKLKDVGGEGGLIAMDRDGNICLPFNSAGMYRGYVSGDGEPKVAIFKEL
jgi:L-asparaginase / beta-aspartyl-peptidase